MADNGLDPWQLLEDLTPRAHIFANAAPKLADLAFLTVLLRVDPGDTQ